MNLHIIGNVDIKPPRGYEAGDYGAWVAPNGDIFPVEADYQHYLVAYDIIFEIFKKRKYRNVLKTLFRLGFVRLVWSQYHVMTPESIQFSKKHAPKRVIKDLKRMVITGSLYTDEV